jgi:tetratricopeptide (TPR) repeat protein
MRPTLSRWQIHFLLLFLLACAPAKEVQRLIASAEESEKKGQVEVAAELYDKAAHLIPSDFDIQYRTAVLYLKLNNLEDSEEHFKQALALKPDVGQAHLNLGVIFLKKGNKEEGRRELLEALRLDPRLTKAYYNLGLVEAGEGRFLGRRPDRGGKIEKAYSLGIPKQ